jgi:hypothetical protein
MKNNFFIRPCYQLGFVWDLEDIFLSCTKMRTNRAWKIIKTGCGI